VLIGGGATDVVGVERPDVGGERLAVTVEDEAGKADKGEKAKPEKKSRKAAAG
jgi:hypothetical protein